MRDQYRVLSEKYSNEILESNLFGKDYESDYSKNKDVKIIQDFADYFAKSIYNAETIQDILVAAQLRRKYEAKYHNKIVPLPGGNDGVGIDLLRLLINDSIEELTGSNIEDFSSAKNIYDPNLTLADCLYAITLYAEQYAKDVYYAKHYGPSPNIKTKTYTGKPSISTEEALQHLLNVWKRMRQAAKDLQKGSEEAEVNLDI
jgi:hypothetical protein